MVNDDFRMISSDLQDLIVWLFALGAFIDEQDDVVSSILSFFEGYPCFLGKLVFIDGRNDQASWMYSFAF